MLHAQHQGKGYMQEALACIIQYGFERMLLNRIEAFISSDNLPSIRSVERQGFVKEGVLREHYKHQGKLYDSVVYSILREEYKTRQKA